MVRTSALTDSCKRPSACSKKGDVFRVTSRAGRVLTKGIFYVLIPTG